MLIEVTVGGKSLKYSTPPSSGFKFNCSDRSWGGSNANRSDPHSLFALTSTHTTERGSASSDSVPSNWLSPRTNHRSCGGKAPVSISPPSWLNRNWSPTTRMARSSARTVGGREPQAGAPRSEYPAHSRKDTWPVSSHRTPSQEHAGLWVFQEGTACWMLRRKRERENSGGRETCWTLEGVRDGGWGRGCGGSVAERREDIPVG
mmetsp:Transcript_45112/g.63141  ORF Transcript_45112/g.63141 Transcript_45112/m.63141 type:complete len:204 (-) Transcript_45112:71-682(-)